MPSSSIQTSVDIEFDAREQGQTLPLELQLDIPRPDAEIRAWVVQQEARIQSLHQEERETERTKYAAKLTRMMKANEELIRVHGGVTRLDAVYGPVPFEFNDHYQFPMASIFMEEFPERRGTYVLYHRKTPEDAGGLRVFGVSRALHTLQNFRFDPRFLYDRFRAGLMTEGLYKKLLSTEKLDITVHAVSDGEFIGPNTPIMMIEGPLWQVQLVETPMISCFDFPCGTATRTTTNCAVFEKPIVDFSARRATGPESGTITALAALMNGAVGVANTITPHIAQKYGIDDVKTKGTTAHSYTEVFLEFDESGMCLTNPALSELKAYQVYAKYFPRIVVLIDTIRKDVGLQTAVKLYFELGLKEIGIRDDSNLSGESVLMCYDYLKEHGVRNFFIVISDDLKPEKLREIRSYIEEKRGEQFYKELMCSPGIGTNTARPDSVGVIFKLAEWEENGVKHRVSKASGTIAKASFPPVLTYRDDQTMQDENRLPEEDPPPFKRCLQQYIDFNRLDLHLLRRSPEGIIPRKYLAGEAKLAAPTFSERAEDVRGRIQKALKETEPLLTEPHFLL